MCFNYWFLGRELTCPLTISECNIKYYEGPTSLNWKTLLATIRKDPKKFWEDGGWNFLNTESSSDEENEDEDAEDAYNPSEQEDEDDAVRVLPFKGG